MFCHYFQLYWEKMIGKINIMTLLWYITDGQFHSSWNCLFLGMSKLIYEELLIFK